MVFSNAKHQTSAPVDDVVGVPHRCRWGNWFWFAIREFLVDALVLKIREVNCAAGNRESSASVFMH
jgi:hypothetical protein